MLIILFLPNYDGFVVGTAPTFPLGCIRRTVGVAQLAKQLKT